MRIAVYLNHQHELCDFLDEGSICLFEGDNSDWSMVESFPLRVRRDLSLCAMKTVFVEALNAVKECRHFIVHERRGVFRVFLEDAGFQLWESTSEPIHVQLNEVARLDSTKIDSCAPVLYPQPVGDASEEIYRVNMLEVMSQGRPLISREILIPFLETTSFKRLEVICDHAPRWFEFELPDLSMKVESREKMAGSDEMKIVLVPTEGERTVPKGRTRRSCGGCSCGG